MTRLNDAFERLIGSRPPGDADEVLAAAERRAAATRTRQRALLGLGTAAAVVALVVAAVVATSGGADDPEVRTGPGPTSTTTATTTTVATPATVSVTVSFSPADDPDCTGTVAVAREVPADDPLGGAIDALLEGPTAEEADAGITSWFSEDTAGMRTDAEVLEGVAFVVFDDFSSIIPNASTSCGSASLLAQLDATVGGIAGVERAIYTFDGSAEAFYHWLQMDVPDGAWPEPGP